MSRCFLIAILVTSTMAFDFRSRNIIASRRVSVAELRVLASFSPAWKENRNIRAPSTSEMEVAIFGRG